MKHVQRFLGVLLVMGYVCSGEVAHAATYYVSKGGNNGNSCGQAQSQSSPKLTLNNAVACLGAGDTLYVRGGVYEEALMTNSFSQGVGSIASGTSWDNKVRIAAYPGESVWLRPLAIPNGGGHVIWLDSNIQYVEFDGINLDGSWSGSGGLWVSTNNGRNPHHIRFQNAEVVSGGQGSGGAIALGAHTRIGATGSNEIINVVIHGGGSPGLCGYQCASYGIYVEGPNNLIEGCDIYDTSGAGIHVYNASGDSPDNNLIRNNRIHDIYRTGSLDEVWGIIIVGNNNQLYNNVIYNITVGSVNTGNAAISLYGAANSVVYNNTLYGNAGWGIVVASTASGSIIRNNISYGNRLGSYSNFGAGTFQQNNLFTDPLFVNAGGGDFSLRSDSPAIDRGAFLDTVPFDQVGVPRPQGNGYDIGAYEFNWGSPAPAPQPAPDPGPSPSGGGVSPDGTRVPGVSSVVDNALATWTIGSGMEIIRNGVQAAGGYGSQILWHQGTIYVLGDDLVWWRWVNGNWSFYSSNDPSGGSSSGGGGTTIASAAPTASASGTVVPSAPSIVDNSLNVWTIGSGSEILRNGSQVAGGYGSQIVWYQSVIYVRGDDSSWWRWTGSTWTFYGFSAPI